MNSILKLNKLNYIKHNITILRYYSNEFKKEESERMKQFRKKLKETPVQTKNEELVEENVDNALPSWPNNTNPNTGEIGGPRGPEPTRYGDWERKGRVSDF